MGSLVKFTVVSLQTVQKFSGTHYVTLPVNKLARPFVMIHTHARHLQ